MSLAAIERTGQGGELFRNPARSRLSQSRGNPRSKTGNFVLPKTFVYGMQVGAACVWLPRSRSTDALFGSWGGAPNCPTVRPCRRLTMPEDRGVLEEQLGACPIRPMTGVHRTGSPETRSSTFFPAPPVLGGSTTRRQTGLSVHIHPPGRGAWPPNVHPCDLACRRPGERITFDGGEVFIPE